MRHQLKLDIFLTSVRQSWTELHEGAAIRILGKQLKSHMALWTRQWQAKVLFFMCAIIESAQSSFCTTRLSWKVAVLKYSRLIFAGKLRQRSCFWPQYCWILSIAFSLLRSCCLSTLFFFYLCRIHDHWHYIVSKNPMWVMLYANQRLEMSFFFFFLYCRYWR